MEKVDSNFILDQYRSGIQNYKSATINIGLWESEKTVFEKHLKRDDRILDVGCGAGRTTFALHNLGFKTLQGVDLTPEMIHAAKELNDHFQTHLSFQVGDATQLNFQDESFDSVIFSFNGIMSIPKQEQRLAALREIHRVLRNKGRFIFTTHDREKDPAYFDFWESQKTIWEKGEQSKALYEFGDIISTSKNEERQIFIHIPNQEEVMQMLSETGFELIETFYRSDRFTESATIKAFSGECRFWVVQKG